MAPPRSKNSRLVWMAVYGANTPLGKRTIVCRLKSFRSSSLMRAHTPSPNNVPFGTTTPARPGLGYRRNFHMMSMRKRSAVSAVCLSSGKLPWMPFSSSPPTPLSVRLRASFASLYVWLCWSVFPNRFRDPVQFHLTRLGKNSPMRFQISSTLGVFQRITAGNVNPLLSIPN